MAIITFLLLICANAARTSQTSLGEAVNGQVLIKSFTGAFEWIQNNFSIVVIVLCMAIIIILISYYSRKDSCDDKIVLREARPLRSRSRYTRACSPTTLI